MSSSRPGPGSGPGGGRGRPPGWSPLHFRPCPSPYASSPPPRLGSPGMPTSRHPHLPCPRPQWPSPGPPGSPFRLPMHPPSPSSMRCASPVPDYIRGVASPYNPPERLSPYVQTHFEYAHPSRDFEYVGAPSTRTPPAHYDPNYDEVDDGPTTAEIIANQSQDYIDEKLAEYQMTILQLQGMYQKKTAKV